MSKTNKSRAPSRGLPNNSVAHAVARNTMRSHARSVGIVIFLTQDGDHAKGLLSHLTWIIGMGAEIALQVVEGSVTARRQHTVLRNLVQLAIADCRWRADLAEPIWAAVEEARDLMMAHPNAAVVAVAGADFLSARVRSGTVRMDDVAGAEIYQVTPLELAA
ncbi:hypothetical protein [Mitsuaria sp. GD03876]|uniref:hypothetical protein n=1 Tax=Mitsuaria sp. GD03876 TaxID=2975399 RepID=UPI0024489324|nr:hypothetical protein [Mitsuaria sp. GD03876]MDH0866478.1 hypothetical protein [Mitsuaria sp. GD03876]